MSQSDIQSAHITADTTAADADGVCQSQTPAAGGLQTLTINGAQSSGGTGSFTAARFITITSAADETARTFVVTGASLVASYCLAGFVENAYKSVLVSSSATTVTKAAAGSVTVDSTRITIATSERF